MHNILKIISKPDNIAIVIMLFLVGFFTIWAFQQAFRNDRRRRAGLPVDGEGDKKVSVWPNLVRIEMLGALAVITALILWSVLVNAPLEGHSNPTLTPNPAKAPWYFLGLQEMLVYFDPWIAGVVLPGLIIVGLIAIPYLDINPKGNGYYTFTERKFAISVYVFGFHVLWLFLIAIGVFIRGPGWLWYWPWQTWDKNRVIYQAGIDLSELVGIDSTSAAGFLVGGAVVITYFALGVMVPRYLLKKKHPALIEGLGWIRYLFVAGLFWAMVALPIKILLRLILDIKYVWVTPWFNI